MGTRGVSSDRLDLEVYPSNVFLRKHRELEGQLRDKTEIKRARFALWEVIDSRRDETP